MGSPLGPVIAGIFMVELEKSLLPKLSSYMTNWKHYVMTLLPTLNQMLLTIFYLFLTRSTKTFYSLTSQKLTEKSPSLTS